MRLLLKNSNIFSYHPKICHFWLILEKWLNFVVRNALKLESSSENSLDLEIDPNRISKAVHKFKQIFLISSLSKRNTRNSTKVLWISDKMVAISTSNSYPCEYFASRTNLSSQRHWFIENSVIFERNQPEIAIFGVKWKITGIIEVPYCVLD